MRRLQRLIAASVLVALSGAIAGCSSNINSFDPMDWLDWIDTKKKLPGERKPVFPEGVPGLEQGVPKSLYKGAQQEAIRTRRKPRLSHRRRLPRPSRKRPPGRASSRRQPRQHRSRGRARGRCDRSGTASAKEENRSPAHDRAAGRSASRCTAIGRAATAICTSCSNRPRHSRRRCRAARLRANAFIDHGRSDGYSRQGSVVVGIRTSSIPKFANDRGDL